MYNLNKNTNHEEYTKNSNSIEQYLKDENGKELYTSHNNIQTYAFNFPFKEEIYAKDKNLEYYAKYDHKEIYAIDLKKDLEKFITINNENLYCKNKYGYEFYPLDFIGRNKVAKKHNSYFYAKGENDKFYYPLNEYGNEFAVQSSTGIYLLIISETGYPIVPRNRDGSVNYIKDKNNREMCYSYAGINFIGKNASAVGQYPCTDKGDEYYPDDYYNPKYATDIDGKFKYALSKNNMIIYPSFLDEEMYITDEYLDSYTILNKNNNQFSRYVKNNSKEKYPIKYLKNGRYVEMIMHNLYALNGSKEFYPKDSYKNEYINSIGILLDSYPITSDNQIIIPNHNNEPLVKLNDSHLLTKIKCLLYREEFKRYDFLLNCNTKNYPILHSQSFSSISYLKYIIVILSTIAFILFFILIVK